MTTEWGALAGVFPIDKITIQWLQKRAKFISKRSPSGVPSDVDGKGVHARVNEKRIQNLKNEIGNLVPDKNAFYAKELILNLDTVQPLVSGPNSVKFITPVKELSRKEVTINKAYLVSCVNSRIEDLADAAKVVKGKKVASGVKFFLAAASSEVQKESEKRGDWQILLDAGAIPLPPGCGPCIGLGEGLLAEGEVGISATNRNFKGRMGSRDAFAYLASPAVVAASAIAGKIDYPGNWEMISTQGYIKVNEKPISENKEVLILPGFQESLEGELVFCPQDNLNTDGIYPGKYTYIDDFTPQQQADVVMENYDPQFKQYIKEGDILVGGFNFGTGSSREQAATALKYRGIKLLLAGSFSETYKRNALNNGFLVIESDELVKDLKNQFGAQRLTIRTGLKASISFKKSILKLDYKRYLVNPIGKVAQELILTGGLENWIKLQIS
jgi:homoaconitate hydratase